MKFAKLSIAAIAVMGLSSSVMAFDLSSITVKPMAKVKLYYETVATDADGSDLFAQNGGTPAAGQPAHGLSVGGASGQALVSFGATGALTKCFGYGLEYTVVDTLGLENNLVSGVRMGNGYGSDRTALDTQHWASQAYITYTPCSSFLERTTFKIGRQYLDTPLAFTENWNIAPNSFDAAVIMNNDIVNTTLVAAYVGKGNGQFVKVTNGDKFTPYVKEGAYAVGAITSLLDGSIPISIWGYDVVNVAQAYWADAGYKAKLGGVGLNIGAQYGALMPDDDANSLVGAGAEDSSGFGVKVGTNIGLAGMNFGLMAAYSSVDDDGSLPLANTATNFKKTKLYTAGIYTDGTHVAQPGSDAFKVKASTKINGIGKLIVQYVHNENDTLAAPVLDVDEIDVILATSLPGGLGAKIIYMNRAYDQVNNDKVHNDADHVRIILSKKF